MSESTINIYSFVNKNITSIEKLELFGQLANFECIPLQIAPSIGIYEFNQRIIGKAIGLFPDWENVICNILSQIFKDNPQKLAEIEKLKQPKNNYSERETANEQNKYGIIMKLKNVIGGIIQNGNDNKAEITVNVLPSETEQKSKEEKSIKNTPINSNDNRKRDTDKSDTDPEKAQEIIFKSDPMASEDIEKKKNEYKNNDILDMDVLEKIITKDRKMFDIFDIIENVAKSKHSVLILGETGTGKELISELIHRSSDRKEKKMITVNCASIPASIWESEMFGHKSGTFTGATGARKGIVMSADNSSLFLDEIGELLPVHQSQLLRLIPEGYFKPVGADDEKKCDVRFIAATNKEIGDPSNFRPDLYERFSRAIIKLPPLRVRKEDIEILITYFNKKIAGELNLKPKIISQSTINDFMEYSWPRNIRQLENAVIRNYSMNKSDELSSQFIEKNETNERFVIRNNSNVAVLGENKDSKSRSIPNLNEVEELLREAFELHKEDSSRALASAFRIGRSKCQWVREMSRSTFYRLLKKRDYAEVVLKIKNEFNADRRNT